MFKRIGVHHCPLAGDQRQLRTAREHLGRAAFGCLDMRLFVAEDPLPWLRHDAERIAFAAVQCHEHHLGLGCVENLSHAIRRGAGQTVSAVEAHARHSPPPDPLSPKDARRSSCQMRNS